MWQGLGDVKEQTESGCTRADQHHAGIFPSRAGLIIARLRNNLSAKELAQTS